MSRATTLGTLPMSGCSAGASNVGVNLSSWEKRIGVKIRRCRALSSFTVLVRGRFGMTSLPALSLSSMKRVIV